MTGRRQVIAGLLAAALPGVALAAPLAGGATIVPFQNSPFPYRGQLPDASGPFLDVTRNGRKGHNSPRGGIYWEDETYADQSVLLAVPSRFDPAKPAVIVVFFHGNLATLERDVIDRQQVLSQFENSALNAVLIAPQFAVNANDSSAGNFWARGAFARFMAEADQRLSSLTGVRPGSFAAMPIVLVAYSGGHNPAAYVLANGDVDRRLLGVILLDAAFGENDKLARWAANHAGHAFFVSAYGDSSAGGNAELVALLNRDGISPSAEVPEALTRQTIAFIPSSAGHDSFVTRAFTRNPLQALLSRISGFTR